MQLTLARWSWKGQAAVSFGVAAAAAALVHLLWVGPGSTHVVRQEQVLQTLRGDIARAVATGHATHALQRQRAALLVRLAALHGAAPSEADAPRVLRDVQAQAEESELWITGFKPAPPIVSAQMMEWSVALEFEGTFPSLVRFLERAAEYPRLVIVTALRLRAHDQPTDTVTLAGSCRLTTVVPLDLAAPAGGASRPAVSRAATGAGPATPRVAP